MASKMKIPKSPIPLNIVTISVLILVVAALYALSHSRQVQPMNVKIGSDGQPGNPTGQQALSYRTQAQEQYPYTEPGANIIPGGNAWV